MEKSTQYILQDLKTYAKNQVVLLAEDDPLIAERLRALLMKFFSNVDWAKDGEDAFEKYMQKKYDIVISDINMPRLNGIGLCRRIKATNEEQCILVISAHDEKEFLIDLLDIGVSGFILKPFPLDQGLTKISKESEKIFFKKFYENSLLQASLDENKQTSKKDDSFATFADTSGANAQEEKKQSEEQTEKYTEYTIKIDTSKTSALEYFSRAKMNDIEDLLNLVEDLESQIIELERGSITYEEVQILSDLFRKFYSELITHKEFENLAVAFLDLSDLFSSIDPQKLKTKKMSSLLVYLIEDFMSFVKNVFIDQSASDIHYLDQSIMSNIEQIKIELGIIKPQQEDNDFDIELF